MFPSFEGVLFQYEMDSSSLMRVCMPAFILVRAEDKDIDLKWPKALYKDVLSKFEIPEGRRLEIVNALQGLIQTTPVMKYNNREIASTVQWLNIITGQYKS